MPPVAPLNEGAALQRPILLPIGVAGGEEVLFMLDTGSRFTILDQSLEEKLGPRRGTRTMRYNYYPGKARWGVYTSPELTYGGVPLRMPPRIFTDDLSRIWPGRPMMGILGMDCLWNYCIQLDFEAAEVRLLDPEHLDSHGLGRSFPLSSLWGAVSTRLDCFDRRQRRFLLDTADYTDGALSRELFQLATERQSGVWIRQEKTVEGMPQRVAYLDECVVGALSYRNVVFRDASVGAASAHNTLGLRFLARHLVTLNFPKKVMYLDPRTTAQQ